MGLWKASPSFSFHLFFKWRNVQPNKLKWDRIMKGQPLAFVSFVPKGNQDEMWYLVIEIGDARSSWDPILFIQTWTKLLIRTELEIEFKFSRGFVSFHSTICGPCLSYIPLSLILTNQLKVVKTFNYCIVRRLARGRHASYLEVFLHEHNFSPRNSV